MQKRLLLSVIVLSLALSTACAAQRAAAPEMMPASEAITFDAAAPMEKEAMGVSGSGMIPGAPPMQTERLVIRNAMLSIVVDDPVKSMDNITELADELGGFVVSADLRETFLESGAKVPYANITIRVPAESFNLAIRRIKEETTQLPQNENITSQDVTSEYTDLESRLRNLEATEEQLTEIMDSAIRTEDVLAVYNQLVQVREQIEVIKWQMKYYEQSAAMSAISVELVADEAVQPLTIGGWQPVGTAKNAVQALINTLKVISNIVIWVVLYVLPVLLVLYLVFILPLSLVWRRVRRPKSRQNIPPTPPSPAA